MGEIETGIPIPEKHGNAGPRTEFGRKAAAMNVGDSVLCCDEDEYAKLRSLLSRGGKRCKSQRVDGGIRVWRVA